MLFFDVDRQIWRRERPTGDVRYVEIVKFEKLLGVNSIDWWQIKEYYSEDSAFTSPLVFFSEEDARKEVIFYFYKSEGVAGWQRTGF